MNVLIIGASSAIGESLTEILLESGFCLFLTGRNTDGLKERFGKKAAKIFNLNLSSETSLSDFFRQTTTNCFDWVIFCAGEISSDEVAALSDSDRLSISFNVNILSFMNIIGTFNSCNKISRGVIGISSSAGLYGNGRYPIYSTTKAALNGFIFSLAKLYSEREMHAFSVCPGPTNTPMRERIANDSSQHQSPSVVSSFILELILKPKDHSKTIYMIKNSQKYETELRELPI